MIDRDMSGISRIGFSASAMLLAMAFFCLLTAVAQDSTLQWQQQKAPATPGTDAIIGGPGRCS